MRHTIRSYTNLANLPRIMCYLLNYTWDIHLGCRLIVRRLILIMPSLLVRNHHIYKEKKKDFFTKMYIYLAICYYYKVRMRKNRKIKKWFLFFPVYLQTYSDIVENGDNEMTLTMVANLPFTSFFSERDFFRKSQTYSANDTVCERTQ